MLSSASSLFPHLLMQFVPSCNEFSRHGCDQVKRCNARLHTIHGAIVKNVHSHNPCAAKTITKIKMRTTTTMENLSVIINKVLGNTSQGTQGAMPRPCAMKKIRQKHKEISAASPNPLNLRELTLSSELQLANGGNEEFLLSDSRPEEEKDFNIWTQKLARTLGYIRNVVL